MFKDKGQITASHAKNQALQSEALTLVPELVGQKKPVGGDYLEITSRQLKRLDEELRCQISSDWIITAIRRFSADEYRRRLAARVDRVDADLRRKEAEQGLKDSSVKHWMDIRSGQYRIDCRYLPFMGESVSKAISAEAKRIANSSDEEVHFDHHLAAQAHYNLIMAGLAANGHGTWGNTRHHPRPSIDLIVDHETAKNLRLSDNGFCETSMGYPVAIETLERHLCDAMIRKIELDESGVPLNVGRKHRTATDAQIAAARAIYSKCGWADCETRLDWCQMHHIHEWNNEGLTGTQALGTAP